LVEKLCRTQSRLCRALDAGREKLGTKTCESGDLNPSRITDNQGVRDHPLPVKPPETPSVVTGGSIARDRRRRRS
jgi:hypothetical protein